MNSKLLIFIFVLCFICVHSKKKCENEYYKCKSIQNCPVFLSMIHGTKQERLLVQKYQCGFDEKNPRVCCPVSKCVPSALPDLRQYSQCCGVEGFTRRVSGGKPTNIYQYTWLALIEYKKDEKISTVCGSSIISTKYVLTAAHCTLENIGYGKPVNVRVGEYNTETIEDYGFTDIFGNEVKHKAKSINIEKITRHPNFVNNDTYKNDIALLRLADAITFNDLIRPICLPFVNVTQFPPQKGFIVAGWGSEQNSWKASPVKRYVTISYSKLTVCEENLKREFGKDKICAGSTDGRGDCTGDSGGPLMHFTGLRHELVGIVSVSFRICGTQPSVYTNVIEHIPWIIENVYE